MRRMRRGRRRGGSRRPRPAPRSSPPRSWVDEGVLLGQIIAGVGLVFVLFYGVVRLLWGSYLGADPSLGLSISLFVLLFGVVVAALLWIGREIFAIAGPAAHRIRDRS